MLRSTPIEAWIFFPPLLIQIPQLWSNNYLALGIPFCEDIRHFCNRPCILSIVIFRCAEKLIAKWDSQSGWNKLDYSMTKNVFLLEKQIQLSLKIIHILIWVSVLNVKYK